MLTFITCLLATIGLLFFVASLAFCIAVTVLVWEHRLCPHVELQANDLHPPERH